MWSYVPSLRYDADFNEPEIGGYKVKIKAAATRNIAVNFHQTGFFPTILGNTLIKTANIIAPNIMINFIF
jgi:hypothetical protein